MKISDINEFQNILLKQISNLFDRKIAKLIKPNWHYGVIDSVVDTKHAYVFVNGGTTSQLIPTTPDVTFVAGDNVVVVFMDGDSKKKFVLCHSAV